MTKLEISWKWSSFLFPFFRYTSFIRSLHKQICLLWWKLWQWDN